MKKLFTLLTLALISIGSAWGAEVGDLKNIHSNLTIYFDDYVTASVSANTLFAEGYLFSPAGNTYASNKGSDADSHLYCCRVKSTTQDKIAFKVDGACTLVLSGERVTDRTPVLNTKADGSGTPTSGTVTPGASGQKWGTVSFNIPAAGTYYIIGSGSDHYLSALKFTYTPTAAPTVVTNLNATADAIVGLAAEFSFEAKRTESYQWYKNSANEAVVDNEHKIAGATSSTYEYTATVAGDEYLYCVATNSIGSTTSAVCKVTATATTLYTITAAYADGQNSTWGTITNLGDNNVIEDEDITFTATANTGYAFVNWTKGGAEYSTNSSITITSTAGNAGTYVANFVKLYKVTYNKSTDYIGTISTDKILNKYDVSKSINEIYADKDGNYTIPAYADKYFHRDGYTFDKWSDGVNTYDSGEAIVLTSDITLAPTWTATTATLSNSQNKNTITWSFAKADMVFVDWQSSDQYGNYVQKATVNGETISIPMQITKGKVGNWGRTDNMAQTNQNTQFTIPAVSGMVVEIPDAYTNLSTTTIAGSTTYTGTGTKSISYTYTGDASTIDIIIGESKQYLNRIVVKYPVTAANVTISPAKEYTTYVTEAPLDFTGLELKAYVATTATASAVTMEPVTTVPANTPLVLKKGSAASYDVPVIASADAPATNNLRASDGVSSIGGDGIYDYILSNGKFYHASAGVLPAGKCYLHLDAAPSGARELSLSFEDEATGVNEVRGKKEEVRDEFYNLAGQRVAQPTKGLYIVNGKKVIVK